MILDFVTKNLMKILATAIAEGNPDYEEIRGCILVDWNSKIKHKSN